MVLPSPAIIITFYIIKHRCPHYFPADKVFSMETFHFQWMKEAFHAGIIIAAALCVHTATQIMPLQQCLIICWTELASMVRVNDNVPEALTTPQRHLQCIAGQLRRHTWRHGPANNGTWTEVNDHCQVQPASSVRKYVMSPAHFWFGPLT